MCSRFLPVKAVQEPLELPLDIHALLRVGDFAGMSRMVLIATPSLV